MGSKKTKAKPIAVNESSRRRMGELVGEHARPLDAERLSTIVNSVPVLISYVDQQHRFKFNNKTYADWFGKEPEEFIGKHLREIMGDEAYEIALPHVEGALAGEVQIFEAEIQYKDAGSRFVKAQYEPQFGENNEVLGFYAVIMDITERKQSEDELRESQQLLRTVVDSVPHTIVVKDLESRYLMVNKSWCEFYGVEPQDAIHIHSLNIPGRPEQDTKKVFEEDQIIFKGDGQPKVFEHTRVDNKGRTRFLQNIRTPISNENGEIRGLVAIALDITERKQAEDALRITQEQLERSIEQAQHLAISATAANKAKSEFLANMSHEIRTPMSAIIGMVDLLLDSKLSLQQQDWAASISNSSQHLMKILNEILDQSKLEAGMISLDPVDFHLASFINDLANLFLPKIMSKEISLEIEIDKALPAGIRADSFRIGQILTNLLSNALKFTNTGSIVIRIAPEPVESGDLMVRFSVTDSGIGVDEEAQKGLFSSFTQADSSTSRTYGGSGLGLSISKHLALLMGGEIGVISTIGAGSTFWFTVLALPVSGNIKVHEKIPDSNQWAASRSLKVLVAEDTDVLQNLIAAILDNLNHETTIVENGKIAANCIEAEDFDIVLMDIRMPVMDGLEATAIIRSMDGEKSKIPIIALTADITVDSKKNYTDIGMNAVCAKPIDLRVLLKTMNTLLNEEIHTLVPTAKPAKRDQPATDIKECSKLTAEDTNFTHVLESVSNIVDQLPESNGDRVPSSQMEGIDPDKFTELLAEYEINLIERCDKLITTINDLAENSTDDEIRSDVSIQFHSIKGGGSLYGYNLITAVAAEADVLLKAKGNLAAKDIHDLNNHAEALLLIAKKRISGDGGDAGRILLGGLKDCSSPRSLLM